ncbi:unnamed protein product [Spodoptera exigua]|nr:unnamed protein product [Spodoptera exigua]
MMFSLGCGRKLWAGGAGGKRAQWAQIAAARVAESAETRLDARSASPRPTPERSRTLIATRPYQLATCRTENINRAQSLPPPSIYLSLEIVLSRSPVRLTIRVLTLCCEIVTFSRNPGLIRAGDQRLGQHVAPGSIVDTILFIVFYTSRSPRQIRGVRVRSAWS